MELEAFTRAVRDILDAVPAMTLATCAGGKPWATDVYFAPRGFNLIFFFSSPGSRHCRNLAVSAACAVTVHPQVAAWREIRGLQREGRAGPMDGLAQKASAMAAYLAKFPFVKDLLAAPGEAAGKMAKVEPHDFRPTRIRYLDNALGFGARFPKLAYVFDENVDIFDDDRVKWAMAWRYDPRKDTLIIPELNVLPLDPLGRTDKPPSSCPRWVSIAPSRWWAIMISTPSWPAPSPSPWGMCRRVWKRFRKRNSPGAWTPLPGRAAHLARHSQGIPRPAQSAAVPGLRQPAGQTRARRRPSARISLHLRRHLVRL